VDPGDAIRIERTGSVIDLKVNGTSSYSMTADPYQNLKIKTVLYTNVSVNNVGASFCDTTNTYFAGFLQDFPLMSHVSPSLTNGSISLTPIPSGESHSYTWTPGSYTAASISSLTIGEFSVRVKDGNGNSSKHKYDLGYKTSWTDTTLMFGRNDSLIPLDNSPVYYRSAYSKNVLPANENGWTALAMETFSSDYMIGFTSNPVIDYAMTYGDIDFGVYVGYEGSFYALAGGSFYWLGYYDNGSILRLERVGNKFYVKSDKEELLYATTASSLSLQVKVLLTSAPIRNLGASFTATDEPVLCNYPTISYSTSPYPTGSSLTFSVTQTGPIGGTYTYSGTPGNTLAIDAVTGLITASLSNYGTYTVMYTLPESAYCFSEYTATTVVTMQNGNCSVAVEPNVLNLCVGTQIQLEVFGGVDGYTWTPGTNLSCNTCSNPVLSYSNNVNTYTITSTRSGEVCGTTTLHIVERNCDDNTIFGCCFSNYGAAVYINDSTTRINIYCNLINEIVYDPVDTIKKGEFVNKGNVNVLLDWIHNGRNNLYTTSEGKTNVFGADQKLKGNSKTHYYYFKTGGNGTKTMFISEYGDSSLNLTSNVLALQNYNFYMTSMDADVQRTTGFASTGTSGYFSRAIHTQSSTPANGYLFPLGAKASSVTPYRYRPLVMSNNSNSQAEGISANFMNAAPSLTDNAFVNPNYSNTVTTKAPSVYQINTAFYHKMKNTVPPGIYSDLLIKSYYYPSDGSFQSMAEWKKDPSQPTDWWSTTPGAAGSNVTSTLSGTYGEIYAQTNGTQTFSNTPYVLSRGGFYINTGQFGNGNNAIISLTAAPINTANPQPQGGGLGQPFGVGQNGGNLGNGAPLVITPNPVAGNYTINVAPANDCETPSMIKFTITQNGVITPTSVLYGVPSQTVFLGQLSEDVYSIDNQNTGLLLYDTPKALLATCVNSIVVSTSTNSDFVLDKTLTSETMNVFIPNVGLTLGNFKVKDASLSVIQNTSISANMNNITIGSPNHSALSSGVYHFEFTITAGALNETIKGQFIIK
jgi:hypothetical protein